MEGLLSCRVLHRRLLQPLLHSRRPAETHLTCCCGSGWCSCWGRRSEEPSPHSCTHCWRLLLAVQQQACAAIHYTAVAAAEQGTSYGQRDGRAIGCAVTVLACSCIVRRPPLDRGRGNSACSHAMRPPCCREGDGMSAAML